MNIVNRGYYSRAALIFCARAMCGYYSRAATIRCAATIRINTVNCSTLNDLFEVNTEGPTLSNFSADAAVDLWWSDCSSGRRVNQKPRKEYRRNQERCSTVASTSGDFESENELDLDSWDNWFHTDSPDSAE